uniref:BTB domain-containing protein n=1 Tax=Panagrolaimus sp. ES5 TaxID=591445 RepID=A0AC34G0J9_9BILA
MKAKKMFKFLYQCCAPKSSKLAETTSDDMIKYPFAAEWIISEYGLMAIQSLMSNNNGRLKSKEFTAIFSSGAKYYLTIYPNGNTEGNRGKTWILLNFELGNEKNVEAEWTFSINTANWSCKINYTFNGEDKEYGTTFCSVDELFDPNKKFIVDGNLTVKVEGILTIGKTESHLGTVENFCGLWNKGYEDFTVVVDKRKIKVHKIILAYHSRVFDAMFQSGMKESIENEVEIIDFSFDIVEKAVKLCYDFKLLSDLSNDESFLLLKFADKYNMAIIQDIIESSLCAKISVLNVCELANASIETNSLKLQNQCMNFLVNCLSAKQVVSNMELLDRDFQKNVFSKFCSLVSP